MRLSLLLACALVLAACDATAPEIMPPVEEPPPAPAVAPLRALGGTAAFDESVGFSAWLGAGAAISSAYIGPGSVETAPFSTSRAGLWAGGLQEGAERASVVYYGDTNFESACSGGQDRLFALDADTTYTDDADLWPRDLGAPVTSEGAPRVYGDRMLWGSFCTTEYTFAGEFGNRHADPLDLQLNVAVYGYDRSDLAGVRFIRYELTNVGTDAIQDLRVGHFSDTETPGTYRTAPFARYSGDAVAYDPASGLSYVYQLPMQIQGNMASSDWVSGFTFLDTPLLSHRILRRQAEPAYEGFTQGPRSATEAVRALDGLAYDGAPMIDPTTGSPSLFAFDANPFTQTTGWLDGRDEDGGFVGLDARQLLSAGPSSLAPGEMKVFTVVSVTSEQGPTSFDSFQEVQQTLAAVRAEPSLWRFTPGS